MYDDYASNNNNNVQPTNGITNNQSQKRKIAPLTFTSSNTRPRYDNNDSNNNNNSNNTAILNQVVKQILQIGRMCAAGPALQKNHLNSNNNNNVNNSTMNGNLLSPPLQNNNNTQNTLVPIKYNATIACGHNKSIQLVGSLDEIISDIANRAILKGIGCLWKEGEHIHFKVDKGCVFGFEGEWIIVGGNYTGQFGRTKNGLQANGSGEFKRDGFVQEGEFIFFPDKDQSELFNGKCFYNGPLPRPEFPDREQWIGTVKNGKFEGFFEVLGPEWRLAGELTNHGTVRGKGWIKVDNTAIEGEFEAKYPYNSINTKQTYIGEMPPKKVVFLANFENGKQIARNAILPNGRLVTHIQEFNGAIIGKKDSALDGQIIDNKLEGHWVKFIKCTNGDYLTYYGLFKDDKLFKGIIYTP